MTKIFSDLNRRDVIVAGAAAAVGAGLSPFPACRTGPRLRVGPYVGHCLPTQRTAPTINDRSGAGRS